MKVRVAQTLRGNAVERRRGDHTAEGARRAEAAIIGHDQEHVGRTLGRPQLLDRRIAGVRILGVIGGQSDMLGIGDG